MTTLSHKIEICPTSSQFRSLSRAVGCARFAWNWGLTQWKTQYEAQKRDPSLPKTSIRTVKATWSAIKHVEFPWLAESPANANLQPFVHLERAFAGFFSKKARYPRFKKRGQHDSFYVDNQKMRLDARSVKLPKIGRIRLAEPLRFDGKVLKGTISREADRWFLSVSVELREPTRPRVGDAIVGVDLGLTTLATLSTGEKIENPRPLKRRLRRLRRLQQAHTRTLKGSSNRRKSAQRIAKMHWKVKNVRHDVLHKLTTRLCRENQAIGIEDLNVRGMLKNRKLARAISDVAWGEFRRQLTYKAPMYGSIVVVADRFYPSSRTCAGCGFVHAGLTLADRVFRCPACGRVEDRDVNAGLNLRAKAREATLGMREREACGARVSLVGLGRPATCREAGSQRVSP